jgi:Zn-dependent protease with chaperone function
MFVARGVVVSLAFFAVTYATLSCLLGSAWRVMQRMRRNKAVSSPGLIFGLRIFPFALSTLVAVFFTFPSFWLMERRSLDEDKTTFFLAACTLVLLGVGIVRSLRATRLTSRAVTQWLSTSSGATEANAATLSAAKGAPALMLVGVCRPKVMFSDGATAVLSANELRVAIRHELGHRRSLDNLKKLLINATPFPGLSGLERSWREAAELAADDSAVESRQDALDLATALIKLSRSANQWTEPELASGLVCSSSAITVRVQRLLEWRAGTRLQRTRPWALLSVLIVGTAIASNYGIALVLTHRLTELLVP